MSQEYEIEVRTPRMLGYASVGHELVFKREGTEQVVRLTDADLKKLFHATYDRIFKTILAG